MTGNRWASVLLPVILAVLIVLTGVIQGQTAENKESSTSDTMAASVETADQEPSEEQSDSANADTAQAVPDSMYSSSAEILSEDAGHLETVSYTIEYDGVSYDKKAYVYVPSGYDESEAMNIFYLMHGSTGSGEQLADAMAPLFDEWISAGTMQPILVVFPTYYPDRSFVVSDYFEDYPLNHFFATEEVKELMKAVEGTYHTFAEGTDDADLTGSRMHRAFGGYSMGGVTAWDVLAYQEEYFAYYMPMAGDCWLNQISDADVDDLLMQGLESGGYSADDFMIIAMVGGNDGTKESMIPQIEALRENHADLITDENLIYWENEGGGHSQESLELEVEHGVRYLWTR